MIYLLAIVLPPLACLCVGRIGLAVLMALLMLTLLGWPVASLWALFVVAEVRADRRVQRYGR